LIKPHLFGLEHSNRDFTKPEGWSKNNFNSAFPASLLCYMQQQNLQPVYLSLDSKGTLQHTYIAPSDILKVNPFADDIYYSFESVLTTYQPLVVGNLPRIDLVMLNRLTGQVISGVEIKLTALPDHSTSDLDESLYGSEIVVRPDTIVYIALSIVAQFRDEPQTLNAFFNFENYKDFNWTDTDAVLKNLPILLESLQYFLTTLSDFQAPLIVQPIWKTQGKSLTLSQQAFDVLVWSNLAITKLFLYPSSKVINRPTRACIWLIKMLYDFWENAKINFRKIIDELSYKTKNDKAFSVSGRMTQPLMACQELITPRLSRDIINQIILGGGQHLLSPERRLDAVILNSLDLFTR
jgi:hypothetical protein